MDAAATQPLKGYFEQIGDVLGSPSRRESFAVYAMGILGDGERKSVEPIASRACGDARTADAARQSLLHLISNARWSDGDVRRTATQHALVAMALHSPVQAWILDDTGFLRVFSASTPAPLAKSPIARSAPAYAYGEPRGCARSGQAVRSAA